VSRKRRHVEIFQAANGAWFLHVKGGNGEIMNTSEGYSGRNGKSHAIRAADELHHPLPIYIVDDEGNSVLLRPEGEVMAGPEGYPTPEAE